MILGYFLLLIVMLHGFLSLVNGAFSDGSLVICIFYQDKNIYIQIVLFIWRSVDRN